MKFSYPQKYLTAIIICQDAQKNFTFKKYLHGIKDNIRYVSKFCKDMKQRHPDAVYINFYSKETKTFKERIYLQ